MLSEYEDRAQARDGKSRMAELKAEEEAEAAERERQKKNPNFLQFTRANFPDVRKHMKANPTAVQVLFFLAQHMAKDNIVVCPTSVMQEELEVSRSTIARAIRYLKKHDLVEIVKLGNVNAYGISGKHIWTTWNHGGRYAVFENVRALASKAENEQLSKKLAHVYGVQRDMFDKDTGEVYDA